MKTGQIKEAYIVVISSFIFIMLT